MPPMFERQLRLTVLDPNSTAWQNMTRSQALRQQRKKLWNQSIYCRRMSLLSLEMAEMKCLFQSLQHPAPVVPESVAYITRAENTVCQLLLACNTTLESSSVDRSVPQFLQTALLAMGHVTCELGTLPATLLAAQCQVWQDCLKIVRRH